MICPSLALDELIKNLKVHKVILEKDYEIYKGKKERVKSIALKDKKESSDDETLTFRSDDEEYAMAIRNFKMFFRRKVRFVRQSRVEKKSFQQRDDNKSKSDRKFFRCDNPNYLIGECPKPPRNREQKAFVGGSWIDSKNEADKTNEETCLWLNRQMRTNIVLLAGITFVLSALTITLSLPVGTAYLPAGTFTLPIDLSLKTPENGTAIILKPTPKATFICVESATRQSASNRGLQQDYHSYMNGFDEPLPSSHSLFGLGHSIGYPE
ncbi:hypothetical protein Tco_0407373 [Tanacetum coccineum]